MAIDDLIRKLAGAKLRRRHVVELPQGPAKPKADDKPPAAPDTDTSGKVDAAIRRRAGR